jgi:hypothetical protein
MTENPKVKFYAYTKQVKMFKGLELPENFVVIFSYGGKQDALINPETDRHAAVFKSLSDLLAAGYVDSSKDDSIAHMSENHRIGLVYHGGKSKQWTKNPKQSEVKNVA